MNSLATIKTDRPLGSISKQTLWMISLAAPLVLAPLWVWLTAEMNSPISSVSGLVLLLLLAACSITDLQSRKIYNWATYSAAVWALLINMTPEVLGSLAPKTFGAIGIQQSLIGGLGCFVLMLVAYTLARGGAGDVKLAAAIGMLIGFEAGVLAIALSYILAGVVISLWSIWTRGPWKLAMAVGRMLGSMMMPQWVGRPNQNDQRLLNTPVPLGGFFAVGTLIVVLEIL